MILTPADRLRSWLDLEPADTLAQLNAASIRYRIAGGSGAGWQPHPDEEPSMLVSN